MKGIGTDIIEIRRIRSGYEKLGPSFLDRIFTRREQDYCREHADPFARFTGRFAAKEAIVKALGSGFGAQAAMHDIEILADENKKPVVHLSDALRKRFNDPQILVSISHCEDYATAVALWV